MKIIERLLMEVDEKYYKNGKIYSLLDSFKQSITLKHKKNYNLKHESLNYSRASLSLSRNFFNNETFKFDTKSRISTSESANSNISAGRFKDLLSLFIQEDDAGLQAFDSVFPGLWSSGRKVSRTGDIGVLVNQIIIQFLNILTSMGINIVLVFEDFQVGCCSINLSNLKTCIYIVDGLK